MDRHQFFCLYANVNSIAELALRQASERILERPVAPAPALSQEELDAQVLASFENLDFSAMEGLHVDAFRDAGDSAEVTERAQATAPFDLDDYLGRAYAAEEQLRERMDVSLARVDLDAVRSALGRLPPDLPLLTEPLSADEMRRWLERYETGDAALNELVVAIRRLDMAH